MKTVLLVSILTAVSTAAYFTGRIYLLMAEHSAQAVAAEQKLHDFMTNNGKTPTLPEFKDRGL